MNIQFNRRWLGFWFFGPLSSRSHCLAVRRRLSARSPDRLTLSLNVGTTGFATQMSAWVISRHMWVQKEYFFGRCDVLMGMVGHHADGLRVR